MFANMAFFKIGETLTNSCFEIIQLHCVKLGFDDVKSILFTSCCTQMQIIINI